MTCISISPVIRGPTEEDAADELALASAEVEAVADVKLFTF